MAHTNSWDEAKPAGSDQASSVDDQVRAFKLDVRERMALDHIWNTSTDHDGKHTGLTLRPDDNTNVVQTEEPNELTGSNAQNFFDLAQTWNTTGTPTFFKAVITDTASNAASLLMDILVGATQMLTLTKAGILSVLGLKASTQGLELPDSVPSSTTNKLYNDGGTLKFNGVTAVGAIFARDVTSSEIVGNVDGTTETHLLSTTGVVITGGVMSSNKKLRMTCLLSALNNTGGSRNYTIRVYFGGVEIATFDATGSGFALGTSASRQPLKLIVEIDNLTASSQVTSCELLIAQGVDVAGSDAQIPSAAGGEGFHYLAGYEGLTVDTTVDATLAVTGELGNTDATLALAMRSAYIEIL